MGVELPLRVVVTILECCVTLSGVKLSIRSFVLFLSNFFLLVPESGTSERHCQIRDALEDILCVSKDIISLKAKFTTGLHKILHRGPLTTR